MSHPWSKAVDAIEAASSDKIAPPSSTRTIYSTDGKSSWVEVITSPVDLHKLSGLDRNTYAAARCIASESSGPGEELLSIAECLRNEAKARNVEIYALLTWETASSYAFTRGKYGEQHGRFASTRQQPTQRALRAAREAITGVSGLTNGARRWVSLRAMDGGKQGARDLTNDAVSIVQKWGAEGWRWIGPLPNVDSYKHACFRRDSVGQKNEDLIAVIELGRAGKSTIGTESEDKPTATVASSGIPFWMLAAGLAAGAIV